MEPLVSITIPCYNARDTLPHALASVVAQTYTNWECIVVDDGSTDGTADLIQQWQKVESRIRYVQLPQNRGRGYARQVALDHCQGTYLAMVDADDWIYPDKLLEQVFILENYPNLGLVSTQMALVNEAQNLCGIRPAATAVFTIHPALKSPQVIPVAHAPSMIRMNTAKKTGYDLRLRRTEDFDFLLRILMKWPFANIGKPFYAYTEYRSLNGRDIIDSQLSLMQIFNKYWLQYPFKTLQNVTILLIKMLGVTMINLFGLSTLHGRTRPKVLPNSEQIKTFKNAWQQVQAHEINSKICT